MANVFSGSKVLFFAACLAILSFLCLDIGSAEAAKPDKLEVDEKVLDQYLLDAGAPQELIDRYEYEVKLDLYGLEGLEYDTTTAVEYVEDPINGELVDKKKFQKPGGVLYGITIPTTKLKAWNDIWTYYYSGVKHKDVRASFEWLVHKDGTKGDKLALAIPSGWEIKAGSYYCAEYQSAGNGTGWTYKSNCGGATYDIDYYGAVWSMTRTADVWHKGYAGFKMKRTSSSAQNKVVGKYVEDIGNSTSWSIGWGPASVSISGNKSSNQRAWDTEFTY